MSSEDPKEVIEREYDAAKPVVDEEVLKYRKSAYWIGPSGRHIASMSDYDIAGLTMDLKKKFPHLHADAIGELIFWSIYRNHLR